MSGSVGLAKSMFPRTGIRRQIWTVFVLQLAAISFATVVGVYAAASVLENVLIKRALHSESDYYWQRAAADPGAALPDTYNMTVYLRRSDGGDAHVPAPLRALTPGYHRVEQAGGRQLVYVSDGALGRLYLVFKQEQVGRLAFLFGAVPLLVVLLIIYLTTWLAYRASRRALSPVIALANSVRAWDPKRPDVAALAPPIALDPDGEVATLAKALHGFATRIENFIAREHHFTREASHELRSPLTVIKIAVDLLLDGDLTLSARRSVLRIKRAAADMEALMEALLILSREADTGHADEDLNVNAAVREEIERAEPLVENRPVRLVLDEQGTYSLHAPPKVFGVMIGNLIRNACMHIEQGEVRITIGAHFVRVQDNGFDSGSDDIAQSTLSRAGPTHGVGVAIVRRLADRFGWPFELSSQPLSGTTATIRFAGMQALESAPA